MFYTRELKITHAYRFFLELPQKGRAVWGVYNTTDSNNINIFTCLVSVSGILSKKPASVFDLYREKMEDYDKKHVGYSFCNSVNRLSMHYFIQDSVECFTGKWYFEGAGGSMPDGAGGIFVLYHMNSQTLRNPDEYFSNLTKMIDKGKTDENAPVLKADDISAASSTEKQLLDAIKPFTIKK